MSRWKSPKRCNNNDSVTVELPTIELEKSSDKEQFIPQIAGNKLYFYSDITRESIYSLNRQIDELTKHLKFIQFSYSMIEPPEITLYISSEGGEVFSALSTVDKILNNPIPINTHCEGVVASSATLISLVGNKRTMSTNSVMLIHQCSSGFWGNYAQIQDEIKNLNLVMKTIKNIYTKYTKFDGAGLDEMLKHDLYLDSQECLKLGLVDSIV
jgi:ATP-dependent protease ClpP protease subunit